MAEQRQPAHRQMDKTEPNEQIEGFNPLSPGSEPGEAGGGVAANRNRVGNIGGPDSAAQAGDVGIGGGDMSGQPTAGAGHSTLADMNARGAGTEVGGGLGEAAGGPGEMTGGSGAGPGGTGTSGAGDAPMNVRHRLGGRQGEGVQGGIGENPVDMGGDVGNTGPTGGLEHPGS